MNKMKMWSVCIVLCCIFSTPLFSAGQDENSSPFAKIVYLNDGIQVFEVDNEFSNNEHQAVLFLPERKDEESCMLLNRDQYNLHLYFDEQPLSVMVYNDDEYFSDSDFTWGNDYTDAELSIPEETYDIMVIYYSDSIYKEIINENVVISQDLDLTIESTDAIYTVELSPLDENGNAIPLEDEIRGKFVIKTRTPMQSVPTIGFSFNYSSSPVSNVIKHSSVSENYGFEVDQIKAIEGKVYEISYDEYSGVSSSFDLINDPSDFRYSQTEFSFNPDVEQQYLTFGSGWIDSTGYTVTVYSTNINPIESNTTLDVYISNVINPSRLPSFVFPFATYVNSDSSGAIYTPFYYVFDDNQQTTCAWNYPPANYDVTIDNGECLNYNMTIPYLTMSYSFNNYLGMTCIVLRAKLFGSENQFFVMDGDNSSYRVIHDGDVVASGKLGDFSWLFGLSSETYSFIVDDDNYYINGMLGAAEYNLTFDLGADDPDSPYLTSFKIKNDDEESVTSLPQNGNGTIEFTAADFSVNLNYDLAYSPIDSAKVYYKDHNADQWQELTINEESSLSDTVGGQYFIGDVSPITTQYTNGTYVDLKIRITDEAGNSNEQTFQPALYISGQITGDFNGDGYVDATDLQMFGDHWHFVYTDAGWDAIYDLDPDSIIDASDLQIFGDHWHEGTPPTLVKGEGGKGPNADAGIVFDLDATTAGNQNLTYISSQDAGSYIRLDVYATGVHNLDTYEFEVVYDSTELEYVSSAATNPLTYEENILTSNGGSAVGWMVDDSTPGILSIAYTLTGTDTTQAPEGEGLLADIVFKAKVATHGTLSFGNVTYYDTEGVSDVITDTGTATLPVELSAFTATYDNTNGYTSIEWTTASETDVIGFNVYRSTEDYFDTAKQINVDVIAGHGTTTEMNTYEFIDLDNLNFDSTYYYWLESVEYGGISTVYSSINITPEEGTGGYVDDFESNSLSNFPNPFKNSTTISYSVKGMLKSQPVEINIYNILGQLVDTVEGKNGTASWNTSDHSTGIYFYKLNTDSYTEIKKMMVTK